MPVDFDRMETSEASRPLGAQIEARAGDNGRATLFIGLGGTGTETVARIKQHWMAMPAAVAAGNAKFFCIDTVPFELQSDSVVRRYMDPETEYDSLIEGNRQSLVQWALGQRRLNPAEYERLFGWYDESWPLPSANFDSAGAGGIRQIGRMALARALPDLEARLTTVLTPLMTARQAGDANRDELNIMVIAGACGGTGSGIFLDIVRLLHKIYRTFSGVGDPSIRAFLVLPTLYERVCIAAHKQDLAERQKPNGYAMLRELDYALSNLTSLADADELFLPALRGTPGPSASGGLLSLCYLVDDVVPGSNANIPDRAAMVELLAEAVASLGVSALGNVDDAQLVDGRGALMRSTLLRHRTAYSGIGIIRAIAPAYSVTKFHGRRLLHDVVRHHLCADSCADASVIEEDLATGRLAQLRDDLLSALYQVDEKLAAADAEMPLPDGAALTRGTGAEWLENLERESKSLGQEDARLGAMLVRECAEIIESALKMAEAHLEDYIDSREEGLRYAEAALRRLEDDLDALFESEMATLRILDVPLVEESAVVLEKCRRYAHSAVAKALRPGEKRALTARFIEARRAEVLKRLRLIAQRAKTSYLSQLSERGKLKEVVGKGEVFTTRRDESVIDGAISRVTKAMRVAQAAATDAAAATSRFTLEDGDGALTPSTYLYPSYLRQEAQGKPEKLHEIYASCVFSGERADLTELGREVVRRLKVGGLPGLMMLAGSEQQARDLTARLLRVCAEVAHERLTGDHARKEYGQEALPTDLLSAAAADGVEPDRLFAELASEARPQWIVLEDQNLPPYDLLTLCVHNPATVPESLALRTVGGMPENEAVLLVGEHGVALEAVDRIYEMRDKYRTFARRHREPLHIAKGLDSDLPDPAANDLSDIEEEVYETLALGLLLGRVFETETIEHDPRKWVRIADGNVPPERLAAPIEGGGRRPYVMNRYRMEAGAGLPVFDPAAEPWQLGNGLHDALMAIAALHGSVREAVLALANSVLDCTSGFLTTGQLRGLIEVMEDWRTTASGNAVDADIDERDRPVWRRLAAEIYEEIPEMRRELADLESIQRDRARLAGGDE